MRIFPAAITLLALTPKAEARYSLTDLLRPGKHSADLMTLGMDPATKALADTFATALKNPALMSDMMKKMKPGQPMPYDSRLGMTQAEYDRMGEGLKAMKILPTGQKAELLIEQSGDTITLKSDSCSLLKAGAKFDKTSALLSLAGYEPMKSNYFENHSSNSPMAPLDGFSYHPPIPGKRVEIVVGRRTQENFCIVSCTYKTPPTNEDVLLRYDCVSAPSATAAPSVTAVPAPATPTGGVDVLAGFESLAQTQTKADAATAAPAMRAAVVVPPLPPPPSAVAVPVKVTDKTPAYVCRAAWARYKYVTPSLVARCKDANQFSAHVLNVYTYLYKGGIDGTLFDAIMQVSTQDKEDCAVQIAKQYAGSMTTKYFKDTCL
jgi:hypothetical protein